MIETAVDKYLNSHGISFPKFIIYENNTGRYIDDARTIRERNERIRHLKRWKGFDIRWNFYNDELRKSNPSGMLLFRGFHYSLETSIRRELEMMPT